jgi:hypothetical protein
MKYKFKSDLLNEELNKHNLSFCKNIRVKKIHEMLNNIEINYYICTMEKKMLLDEWVDRKYIMETYLVSHRTYNTKVKLLDTGPYTEYTKEIKNKRYIHKSILDEIFLSDRIPNYNQPEHIRKWVQKQKWDYIGNITPDVYDIKSNVFIIESLFKIIKSICKDAVLFYTIGQSEYSNKHYYTHFLIKSKNNIDVKYITTKINKDEILKMYLKPKEIKTNKRLMLDPYDEKLLGNRGVNFILKYNINLGLIK